jgi:hypothetical protein
MRDCVVFNGVSSLEVQEIRVNVVRIPEVIKRIHQAQQVWDEHHRESFDLANFMASDDRIFLSNIKLKSLASAIVQIGLYDRYLRWHREPEFFVGDSTGDSPVLVATGQKLFSQLIGESPALSVSRPSGVVRLADEPELSGIQLTQYLAYRRYEENKISFFQEVEVEGRDVQSLALQLIEELDVRRFINIGPGSLLFRSQPQFEMVDIQVLESIDLDPMLSWFWPSLRAQGYITA